MVMITIVLATIIVYFIIEYILHCNKLKSIPIRIHVNGTRGKSSVTRLIAGALRHHGLKTYAKTTGTFPRLIVEDGKEFPIYRPLGANILEQLRVISIAANNKAQALVIECMALQPNHQSLTELKFVKSTHGVITNARADHLDVMGPREEDVVDALAGTVPVNGKLFTAEKKHLAILDSACADRNTELIVVEDKDVDSVSQTYLSGFDYVEHKENIALVLKICESLNIPRNVAIQGMWKAKRDAGAMSEYQLNFFGRKILFINGFAANDPKSSEIIWRMSLEANPNFEKKIIILTARQDRPDRSLQLGRALGDWPKADNYIIMGTGVYVLFREAVKSGIDSAKMIYAEDLKVEQIFEQIISVSGQSAIVMGLGNIVGPGMELVNFMKNRRVLTA